MKPACLLCSLLFAMPLLASAQGAKTYPERPVRVIVPAAAGGGQDIVSRALAARSAPTSRCSRRPTATR